MTVPSILLIHGFGSSFDHGWRRPGWVDRLTEEGRDILAYDLPGHGTRKDNSTPEDFVDIAAKLMATLTTPVDIISFSAGARVALRIACLNPAMVRRLVVIGAGDGFMVPYIADPLIAAILADQPPEELRLATFHRLARSKGNSIDGLVEFLRRHDHHFTPDALSPFKTPTLMITGGRDTVARGSKLREALGNPEHLELPECDHFGLPLDPRTIDAALQFLAE